MMPLVHLVVAAEVVVAIVVAAVVAVRAVAVVHPASVSRQLNMLGTNQYVMTSMIWRILRSLRPRSIQYMGHMGSIVTLLARVRTS
jgi:hypothetical protein